MRVETEPAGARWVRERFEPHHFCPAAGQGSLGIETRKDDPATLAAIAFLDDAATCYAVTAERAALGALGGGCQVPIGIHCRVAPQNESGEWQEIFGVVADPATGKAIRAHHEATALAHPLDERPGPDIHLGAVRMDFRYRDYFNTEPSTGYETLVYDCMIGDATLFQRADSVEAGWAVVQPILDLWHDDKTVPLEFYPAGTAGPENRRRHEPGARDRILRRPHR